MTSTAGSAVSAVSAGSVGSGGVTGWSSARGRGGQRHHAVVNQRLAGRVAVRQPGRVGAVRAAQLDAPVAGHGGRPPVYDRRPVARGVRGVRGVRRQLAAQLVDGRLGAAGDQPQLVGQLEREVAEPADGRELGGDGELGGGAHYGTSRGSSPAR
jgi:hypothetical protein